LVQIGTEAALVALLDSLRDEFDAWLAAVLLHSPPTRDAAESMVRGRLRSAPESTRLELLTDLAARVDDATLGKLVDAEELLVFLHEKALDERTSRLGGAMAAVIRALAQFDVDAALLAARKVLRDPAGGDRSHMPYLMLEIDRQGAIPHLLEQAAVERSAAVAWSIGRSLSGVETVDLLSSWLASGDAVRRKAACCLAGRVRTSFDTEAALLASLDDLDAAVAEEAQRSLKLLREATEVEALVAAIISEREEPRRWVLVDCLLELADPGIDTVPPPTGVTSWRVSSPERSGSICVVNWSSGVRNWKARPSRPIGAVPDGDFGKGEHHRNYTSRPIAKFRKTSPSSAPPAGCGRDRPSRRRFRPDLARRLGLESVFGLPYGRWPRDWMDCRRPARPLDQSPGSRIDMLGREARGRTMSISTTEAPSAPPRTGEIVRVRQRRYVVEEVVGPGQAGDATLVRMACLDDDAQGQPLDVLWELEVDGEVLAGEAWRKVAAKGFDPPDRFSAYLHAVRWNCVTATDLGLFQAPFRAGIRIDAYQLEPLRKALRLPRVNLFIADDVGLGKTIEAGLIARELLLRKKARDIVVACPPSMLPQWRDELEARFGLTFQVLDKDYVRDVRRQRGYGVNPWTTHARFLISHRLLIDEAYAAPMRDWLGEFRPGSLLILDEAHHAAPASGSRYAIDSKITRAVRDLAGRFEHWLFLSATPHNGHSNSFSALLEILDPQRFCRGVPVAKRPLEDVMVRRLKEDLREVAGGFPRRVVRQVDIDGLPADAPELRLSALLNDYRELRERRLRGETKRKQAAAALLISGLQQRLLSSVEAFARTLRVHRRTVERQRERERDDQARAEPKLPLLDLLGDGVASDDDRATLTEEELRAEEDAQVEAATLATGASTDDELFAEERRLLDQMTEVAETARGRPDARVRYLFDWIRGNMCPDLPPAGGAPAPGRPARWNETRVILFTEYDDTKRYLRDHLGAAIAGTDRAEARIAVYHGPTPSLFYTSRVRLWQDRKARASWRLWACAMRRNWIFTR